MGTRVKSKTGFGSETISGQESYNLRPQADLGHFVPEVTRNIGGDRFGFLHEAFQNSLEAKATQFVIGVFGRGADRYMILADDGNGMGDTGKQGFVDLARSPYRDVKGARNKHGFGRMTLLHKFRRVRVYDQWAGIKPGMVDVLDFLWSDLVGSYDTAAASKIRVYHCRRGDVQYFLPAGAEHGVCLVLREPAENSQPLTVQAIVKNMGKKMAPRMAEMIRVWDGEKFWPLEKRDVLDELRFSELHSDLGAIDIRLYIPKKVDSTDELWVGWCRQDPYRSEHIVEWHNFARSCPEETWDPIVGEVLNDPRVKGFIHVEKFMAFRAGSSDQFTPELYRTPEFKAFIRYLLVNVVPGLQLRLGSSSQQDDTQKAQQFCEALQEICGITGPKRKDSVTPPRTRSLIRITPAAAELVFDECLVFSVSQIDPKIRQVEWVFDPPLGKLSPRFGRSVRYRAPMTAGRILLTARDVDNAATKFTATIDVVPQRNLRIRPAKLTLAPLQEHILKAANTEDYVNASLQGADLIWRLDPRDEDGSFIKVVGDKKIPVQTVSGSEVLYRAGAVECIEGFTVTLSIAGRKNSQETSCVISVQRLTDLSGPSPEGGLQLEDVVYNIAPLGMDGDKIVVVRISQGNHGTVQFNWKHPMFCVVSGIRKAEALAGLQALVREHILARNRDAAPMTAEEFNAKANKLLNELVEARLRDLDN